MSHYNVKPIRLDFKPSMRLTLVLAVAALLACLALAVIGVAFWVKLLAMTAVLTATLYHVLYALQHMSRSCIVLSMDSKGAWQLLTRGGDRYPATILPSSFVTPDLTVLNCSLAGKRLQYHLVILPDAVDADAFRRMRVWLRWGPQLPATGVEAAP